MGIDEQSKGVQVYWPDKITVGVERNVYYDKSIASVPHLEGEDSIVEMKPDLPIATKSIVPPPNPIPMPPRILSPPQLQNPIPLLRNVFAN